MRRSQRGVFCLQKRHREALLDQPAEVPVFCRRYLTSASVGIYLSAMIPMGESPAPAYKSILLVREHIPCPYTCANVCAARIYSTFNLPISIYTLIV